MKIQAISLCLVAVLFQSLAFAEPYQGQTLPSDNQLKRALVKIVNKNSNVREGFKIIGRLRRSDNIYEISSRYSNGVINTKQLIRLDTNIWLIEKIIVEK